MMLSGLQKQHRILSDLLEEIENKPRFSLSQVKVVSRRRPEGRPQPLQITQDQDSLFCSQTRIGQRPEG